MTWKTSELTRYFNAFSDSGGIYKFSKRIELKPGFMIYKRDDDVFDGLEQYGIIRSVTSTELKVSHSVSPNVLWRLPHTVIAGKARRCADCRENDDPKCSRCKFVPFPLIFACKSILPGQEILCLYSKSIKERGLPCTDALTGDEMKPRWDDHY